MHGKQIEYSVEFCYNYVIYNKYNFDRLDNNDRVIEKTIYKIIEDNM